MRARTKSRERKVPDALALGSKFDNYKPEEEKEVRNVEVKEHEVLKQLKDAWGRHKATSLITPHRPPSYGYEQALETVRNLSYSAADVEKFSLVLAEFQDEENFPNRAGAFLSALINNGKDTDYIIHTQHLGKKIHSIGRANTKRITVNGAVGNTIGSEMKSGSITVNGDVGYAVGEAMECGKITVNGDAGYGVGWGMEGGIIIVNGNAGDEVGGAMSGGSITVNGTAGVRAGETMKNGQIHLEGKYESLASNIKGGKIYHKGKLIKDIHGSHYY